MCLSVRLAAWCPVPVTLSLVPLIPFVFTIRADVRVLDYNTVTDSSFRCWDTVREAHFEVTGYVLSIPPTSSERQEGAGSGVWTGCGRTTPLPRFSRIIVLCCAFLPPLLAQSWQGAAHWIPCVERRSIDYWDWCELGTCVESHFDCLIGDCVNWEQQSDLPSSILSWHLLGIFFFLKKKEVMWPWWP